MSDNEIDAELLALADDDSASEGEEQVSSGAGKSKSVSSKSASPAPPASPPQQRSQSSVKGVARPKQGNTPRTAISTQLDGHDESNEEGEASSAHSPQNSLGSGAMSESDSDKANAKDDGVLFPVDGIFRSEKEKADINAMPEIERERLLAERAEEAEKLAQSAKLRQMMQAREKVAEKSAVAKKKRKAASTDLEDSPRKSSRTKTRQSENLAAYKRQREQRHEQRKQGDARKSLGRKSPSQDAGLSDGEADVESEVEWDDGSFKKPAAEDEAPPTLHEFRRVQVGRSNFAKVCYYPGFENCIVGCFARIAIGPNRATGENAYRMAQIKSFITGKPYVMEGVNGRPVYTQQYIIAAIGKSEKEWPFTACSDSNITDAELNRYLITLTGEGLRTPTSKLLSDKCDDIHKLLDHRWSESEISGKLQRNDAAAALWRTQERERMERYRKLAEVNNNETDLARWNAEIAALDSGAPKPFHNGATGTNNSSGSGTVKPLSQQDRLAEINRANRRANTEEIRKAQIEEKRAAQKAQKEAHARGETVADPFARVKTRARVMHDANGGDSLLARKKDDLFGEGSDLSRAGTPAAGSSRAGTPTPAGSKPTKIPKTEPVVRRPIEKTGIGGVSKALMDDDILGAMDLGIEIDI